MSDREAQGRARETPQVRDEVLARRRTSLCRRVLGLAATPSTNAGAENGGAEFIDLLARTGNTGTLLSFLVEGLLELELATPDAEESVEIVSELAAGCNALARHALERPAVTADVLAADGGLLRRVADRFCERASAPGAKLPELGVRSLLAAVNAFSATLRALPPASSGGTARHALAIVTTRGELDLGLLLPWRVGVRTEELERTLVELDEEMTEQVGRARCAVHDDLPLDPAERARWEQSAPDVGLSRRDVPQGIHGPSAGIAHFVGLVSYLSGVPARRHVALSARIESSGHAGAAAGADALEELTRHSVRGVGGLEAKARAVVEAGTWVRTLVVAPEDEKDARRALATARARSQALYEALGLTDVRPRELDVVSVRNLAEVLRAAFDPKDCDRVRSSLAAVLAALLSTRRPPSPPIRSHVPRSTPEPPPSSSARSDGGPIPADLLDALVALFGTRDEARHLCERSEGPGRVVVPNFPDARILWTRLWSQWTVGAPPDFPRLVAVALEERPGTRAFVRWLDTHGAEQQTHVARSDAAPRAALVGEHALLAELYYSATSARLLATGNGFPRALLPDFTNAAEFWEKIWQLVLEEGVQPGDPTPFLRAAAERYPHNPRLARWR